MYPGAGRGSGEPTQGYKSLAGGLNPSSVTPFINIGHTQSLHPLQPQVHTINTHSTCLTHIQSPFQPNTHSHSTHLHCPPKGPPPTHNFHTKLILYYTPKTPNTRAQPTQTHDSYTSHTTQHTPRAQTTHTPPILTCKVACPTAHVQAGAPWHTYRLTMEVPPNLHFQTVYPRLGAGAGGRCMNEIPSLSAQKLICDLAERAKILTSLVEFCL